MDIKKKAFWRRRASQDVIRRNDGTHPSSSGYFAAPSFRTEQADFSSPTRFLLAPEVFCWANGSARAERNLSSIKHPAQPPKPQRKNGAPSTEQQSTPRQFWQTRFYDFDAWSRQKEREKPDYTHANPSKNKLTDHPRDWPSSSFWYNDRRARTAEDGCQALRNAEAALAQKNEGVKKEPTLAKTARMGHPRS